MKANLPQKPKTLNDLSPATINRLNSYYDEILHKELEELSIRCQRIIIKYFTCVLHDCNVDNESIMIYIGNMKRYKRATRNFKTNDELEEFLDKNIAKFMDNFPKDFVDKLTTEEL